MEHALLGTMREILAQPYHPTQLPVLDELTGTYAVNSGVMRLDEEAKRALRYRHSLSCFVVEIEALDAVSEQHGPARVDRVLQDVGAILQHSVRATDVVCRLDQNRFLLITPRMDARAAETLGERIRQRVARHRFPIPGGTSLTVTASLGIACSGNLHGNTAVALLESALDAIAAARAAGGNLVVLG